MSTTKKEQLLRDDEERWFQCRLTKSAALSSTEIYRKCHLGPGQASAKRPTMAKKGMKPKVHLWVERYLHALHRGARSYGGQRTRQYRHLRMTLGSDWLSEAFHDMLSCRLETRWFNVAELMGGSGTSGFDVSIDAGSGWL